MTSIGDANGPFQYTIPSNPIKLRQGNLNNAVYPATKWNFVVTSTHPEILASMLFSDTVAGHTGEWCIGTCMASPTRMAVLTVKDPSGIGLQFAFELLSETNDPPTPAQIGAFVQAIYGVLGTVPIALFSDGTLRPVPM